MRIRRQRGGYLETSGGQTLLDRLMRAERHGDPMIVTVEVTGRERVHVRGEADELIGADLQPGLEPGVRHTLDFRRWVPPANAQLIEALDEAIQAGAIREVG